MGRNALSNADKLITGSAPKPELRPGTPAKPIELSPRAALEWDRLSRELADAGLQITVAHRAPLTLAATIAADLFTDWEVIKKDGAYIQGRTGLAAHPAVKRMDALRRDYIKVLGLLGLRAAVSGEKPGEEDDLDAVLNG
jgi:phage terminase small subunit